MKIYTRTGDSGTTGLFSGQRVPKHDLRIECTGCLDEVNCHLGLAAASDPDPKIALHIQHLQSHLFELGADLANPTATPRITPTHSSELEVQIDEITAALPTLRRFILPGGSPAAAHLHLARSVARRTERVAVALNAESALPSAILTYLNRLSDFLFTLARYQNQLADTPDVEWG